MHVRFVYARFHRHADAHPQLRVHVPCNEYFGPPSLGIAQMASVTPPDWTLDFRDDRLEDVGLTDNVDLVAISCFTPSAKRAMELADSFRAQGKQVVMGGIFPTMMPDEVAPHTDAIVLGEGEGVWAQVLEDAAKRQLKPRYTEVVPFDLEQLPLPRVDLYMDKEGGAFTPDDYPVQIARGCGFACDACVLPAVMGKKFRYLPLKHILGQIEQLAKRGKRASFTEDTSFFLGAPQRKFSEVLDALQGSKAAISYIGTSMPFLHMAPDILFEKMKGAGVGMFYLVGGFDPVTRGAFTGKDPKSYRKALESVKKSLDHGIEPYTSFLVGNEDDDEGTFDRMLEFADKAGIRKAEFAIFTPYPGTPAWFRLEGEGRILSRDWSLYNDANVVFRPKLMSPERLLEGYLYLWEEFYRPRQGLRELPVDQRTIQF
ncbi:MAG: radical SAM protein [Myxococcales bacterium]